MVETLKNSVQEAVEAIKKLEEPTSLEFMLSASEAIANCFLKGGKLLIAGNGGSLCDASHFAEEMTGFFRKKRMALPAIALSDPGHLTCVGNDLGFEFVFSRSIEALGKPGDLFIALTTSGNSLNIIHAVEKAKELGLSVILFLGKGGGRLKGKGDLELHIDGFSTSDRVQEAHMAAIHIIIEMVERQLFT